MIKKKIALYQISDPFYDKKIREKMCLPCKYVIKSADFKQNYYLLFENLSLWLKINTDLFVFGDNLL